MLAAKGDIKLMMPKTKNKKMKPRTVTHPSTPETAGEHRYFSRAVGKALHMLELLSRSNEPMSLNDLSKQTQLTKSSAFRLLQTLETLNYIRRDVNGHYLSSPEKKSAVSAQYLNGLVTVALEPMRKLNMEFGETISMAVLMHNHIEVVYVIESASLVRMTNIVGRILPPHASSMGKVITAWQDANTRKRLLQSYGLTRYNENTIVDEHTIEAEFELIRTRGYSTDAEESTPGGSCLGMAIFSAPGKVEAAISLSMPKSRMPTDETKKQRLLQALKNATKEIERKLAPQDQAGARVA